jgi:hypothetical protein
MSILGPEKLSETWVGLGPIAFQFRIQTNLWTGNPGQLEDDGDFEHQACWVWRSPTRRPIQIWARRARIWGIHTQMLSVCPDLGPPNLWDGLTDGAEIWWQCSGGVAIGFAQFFFLKKMILKICDFSGIFFSNHIFFLWGHFWNSAYVQNNFVAQAKKP